jgi:hypothetical protein
MKILIHSIFALLFISHHSAAQLPGTHLYYGLLHAHTLFSDGSGTPEEAYQKAKAGGLNFFAVTEHNHSEAEMGVSADRKDGILIANNHALYNGNSTISLDVTLQGNTSHMNVKSVKMAAEDATTSSFLALYGQEFSTISKGNHVNVLNAPEVIEIPKGEFKQLYDWIDSTNDDNILVQMNHPYVNGDLHNQDADHNDYGIDETALGSGFGSFVANTDKYIQLIEILSGPAMAKTSDPDYHYGKSHEDDYFFYLKQGFHIAPSAGQDNHYKTWGTASGARMGVYATALTKAALTQAFRTYCTFVTEDKNMSVVLSINGSVMGSNISAATDQPLNLEIKVADTDDTSPSYTVEIYGSSIEPKSYAQAPHLDADEGRIDEVLLTGNGTATYNLLSSGEPQFYYVKVTESDGDRAWSAPVWINAPESGVTPGPGPSPVVATIFYWTRNTSSQVYHLEGCSSVNTISPENLRSGTVPPDGRHQHACNVQVGDGH